MVNGFTITRGAMRYQSPEIQSVKTPVKFAKATATAAMVPVWIIRNRPQPKRNPIDGPYASRRKTYWPPARGHIAASSAQQSAPVMVSTPASAQATSSQPGEPTRRDDSADVMKIPDPIIEPTTIIVASSRLRPRTSFVGDSLGIRSTDYTDYTDKSPCNLWMDCLLDTPELAH